MRKSLGELVQAVAESWPFLLGAIAVFAIGIALLVKSVVGRGPEAPRPEPEPEPRPQPPRKPVATPPAPVPVPARSESQRPQVVVVYADQARAKQVADAIAIPCVRVNTLDELRAVIRKRRPAAAFIDAELVPSLGGPLTIPLVAIVDQPPPQMLSTMVNILDASPWVSHVIGAPLLGSPLVKPYMKRLLERLAHGPKDEGVDGNGRVAMLAQASHREARFARIQEYFAKHQVSGRTATAVAEVAEELVMNALYNAPAEAGFFKTPVSRTEDVTLPPERACEISYGIDGGNAFVRIRDTFGALRRERLFEVLNRCNASGVTLDESRGGAGLGMWRVFSAATTIEITVIPHHLTDIVVRIAPKQPRVAKQLLAVDLWFMPDTQDALDSLLFDQHSSLVDHSITLIQPG